MRIGIEAQRIFRPKKHGMDIYALELIKALQLIDSENEYFIFVKPGEDHFCLKPTDNFHIVPVKGLTYADWEQVWLPLAIKKYNIDLLHCTSNTAPLFVNCPIVLTLHDIIYLNKSFSGGSWYQRLGHHYRKMIVPSVFRKALKVVTVSQFEKTTIENHFGSTSKLDVCYNGVDEKFDVNIDEFRIRVVREHLKLPEKYLFFLGNTAPKKNMTGMLAAYEKYVQSSADPLPLVVAESSVEDIVANLGKVNEEILKHIHLPGYIKNHWLPVVYHEAEIFLYPSLRESFGIPIIESMACGTPVITSATSSMPEVAGEAAVLIDPTKPEEIFEAMANILNDKEKQFELKYLGAERATGFRWNEAANQTFNLYQNCDTKTEETHVMTN